jgi:hypothetical protein
MSPRRNGRNRLEGQPRPEVTAGLTQGRSRITHETGESAQETAPQFLGEAVGLVRRHPVAGLCLVAGFAVLVGIVLAGRR